MIEGLRGVIDGLVNPGSNCREIASGLIETLTSSSTQPTRLKKVSQNKCHFRLIGFAAGLLAQKDIF